MATAPASTGTYEAASTLTASVRVESERDTVRLYMTMAGQEELLFEGPLAELRSSLKEGTEDAGATSSVGA